jgi:hypothetical protein
MWTREDAFWVVERLEPKLAAVGVHCALAGSVMYRGSSAKDLDIIIYPHTSTESVFDFEQARTVLVEFFQSSRINECKSYNDHKRDAKIVWWIQTPKGKRVEFFFLS